ncbi:MAG: hypothetical protein J6O55_03640 [Lachnospiraceae bacterium]|nr:hypothetical protein [Lachnospiraceae bacterium]
MIFESRALTLEVIATLSVGEVNDNYLCRELGKTEGTLYTVIAIKSHETVRLFLEMFRSSSWSEDTPLLDSFFSGGVHVMVFPYRRERRLNDFYMGDAYTLEKCEDICMHVILSCISASMPYPLLYLILCQRLLNLSLDNSVYLSYDVDLKELDLRKGERECTTECAAILLSLLQPKASEKTVSYQILSKKTENRSYSAFTDLYRDIRIAAAPVKKRGIIARIFGFFKRNADTLFGILFWICLIFMVIALAMLVSNAFLGDVPWLRIFYNGFKKIGTETLT